MDKPSLSSPREEINHPAHYNSHPSGIEAIDLIEFMDFSIGSALKYLYRGAHKDDLVKDYCKAMWYINRRLGVDLKRGAPAAVQGLLAKYPSEAVFMINDANELLEPTRPMIQQIWDAEPDDKLRSVIFNLWHAACLSQNRVLHLQMARDTLQLMIFILRLPKTHSALRPIPFSAEPKDPREVTHPAPPANHPVEE